MKVRPSVVDIEVTLDHVEPIVMRRLAVPLSLDLDRLHVALQIVIGWTNSRLYEFWIGDSRFGIPDPDCGDPAGPLDARDVTLQSVLEDMRIQSFKYLYDFGDGWEHSIKMGRVEQGASGIVYPFLFKAAGRCPPEDIGGPFGYKEFLQVLATPNHPRHQELVGWWGSETFDVEAIDYASIDHELRNLKRRWARQARKKI